eukprot:CCRYP_001184-RA/>CCRYP_001184-RA protein AED:0.60 eAED:0.60 QI:0/0/0.5/0.5/1/1/2/191/159
MLGDVGIIFPPGLHVDEEGDDVRCFKTCDRGCEVLQHVLQQHLVVEDGGALEGEQPGVLHHGGEKDAAKALGAADEALSGRGGRPIFLGHHVHGISGIGRDGGVVCGRGEEERVEGVAVGGHVIGGIIDEAKEAVGASRGVDGLEEVGQARNSETQSTD